MLFRSNNGANLVRDEVKQDADRAVSARQAATQSESNAATSEAAAASSASNAAASESAAKQSETNAGDYAAVATTAATEAVDAMERATDLAGGDFATHEYVDGAVANALRVDTTVGTRVFFGEHMITGDTGTREVSDIAAGFDFTTSSRHRLTLRRVGDQIFLKAVGVRTAEDAWITDAIPQGFRPRSGEYHAMRGAALSKGVIYPLGNSVTLFRLSTSVGALKIGDTVNMNATWLTDNPWPSSLPGIPA